MPAIQATAKPSIDEWIPLIGFLITAIAGGAVMVLHANPAILLPAFDLINGTAFFVFIAGSILTFIFALMGVFDAIGKRSTKFTTINLLVLLLTVLGAGAILFQLIMPAVF